jgi:hypothetical protein
MVRPAEPEFDQIEELDLADALQFELAERRLVDLGDSGAGDVPLDFGPVDTRLATAPPDPNALVVRESRKPGRRMESRRAASATVIQLPSVPSLT